MCSLLRESLRELVKKGEPRPPGCIVGMWMTTTVSGALSQTSAKSQLPSICLEHWIHPPWRRRTWRARNKFQGALKRNFLKRTIQQNERAVSKQFLFIYLPVTIVQYLIRYLFRMVPSLMGITALFLMLGCNVATEEMESKIRGTEPLTTFEIFTQISRSPSDFKHAGLDENTLSPKSSLPDYRTSYLPSKHKSTKIFFSVPWISWHWIKLPASFSFSFLFLDCWSFVLR